MAKRFRAQVFALATFIVSGYILWLIVYFLGNTKPWPFT